MYKIEITISISWVLIKNKIFHINCSMLCLYIINTQCMVAIIIFSTIQSLGNFYVYYLILSSVIATLFSHYWKGEKRFIYPNLQLRSFMNFAFYYLAHFSRLSLYRTVGNIMHWFGAQYCSQRCLVLSSKWLHSSEIWLWTSDLTSINFSFLCGKMGEGTKSTINWCSIERLNKTCKDPNTTQ